MMRTRTASHEGRPFVHFEVAAAQYDVSFVAGHSRNLTAIALALVLIALDEVPPGRGELFGVDRLGE